MKKLGIISSKGGHLYEIFQINQLLRQYPRFWITFSGADSSELLKNEKKYYAFYPESRNIINFFRNLFLAINIFLKERPDTLISCGAGIAVPFFLVGKYIFGTQLIYIESFDFVSYPSLTGKILYKHSDLFLVQHVCQKKWFPKAQYWGSLL